MRTIAAPLWDKFLFYHFQTILFTTDEYILELVGQNDEYFNNNADNGSTPSTDTAQVSAIDRPPTADTSDPAERPWTCARRRRKNTRRTKDVVDEGPVAPVRPPVAQEVEPQEEVR